MKQLTPEQIKELKQKARTIQNGESQLVTYIIIVLVIVLIIGFISIK